MFQDLEMTTFVLKRLCTLEIFLTFALNEKKNSKSDWNRGTEVTCSDQSPTTGFKCVFCWWTKNKKWAERNFLFRWDREETTFRPKKKKGENIKTNRKMFVHEARPQEVRRAGRQKPRPLSNRPITVWHTLRWSWSIRAVLLSFEKVSRLCKSLGSKQAATVPPPEPFSWWSLDVKNSEIK